MELMDAIKSRYSCHSFKEGVTIPLDDLKKIVEAGMYAPNAGAKRPWQFVIVQNKDIVRQIVAPHPSAKVWTNAAAAIVLVGKPELSAPMPEEFIYLDGAAAIENMLLRATELGYNSCWCGAWPSMEKADALCELLDVEGVPVGTALLGLADKEGKPTGRWHEEEVKYL